MMLAAFNPSAPTDWVTVLVLGAGTLFIAGLLVRAWWSGRRPPRPPESIRAVMADGTEVPLELVYLGVRDGLHQWRAVWVLAERPVSIRGGMIPARTAVSVACVAWKAQT